MDDENVLRPRTLNVILEPKPPSTPRCAARRPQRKRISHSDTSLRKESIRSETKSYLSPAKFPTRPADPPRPQPIFRSRRLTAAPVAAPISLKPKVKAAMHRCLSDSSAKGWMCAGSNLSVLRISQSQPMLAVQSSPHKPPLERAMPGDAPDMLCCAQCLAADFAPCASCDVVRELQRLNWDAE